MRVSFACCSSSSSALTRIFELFSAPRQTAPVRRKSEGVLRGAHSRRWGVVRYMFISLKISERLVTHTTTGNPLHFGRKRLLRRTEQEGSVGPHSHQGGGSHDATGGDLSPIHRWWDGHDSCHEVCSWDALVYHLSLGKPPNHLRLTLTSDCSLVSQSGRRSTVPARNTQAERNT